MNEEISEELKNELKNKLDSAINSAIMEIIITNLGSTYKIFDAVKRITLDTTYNSVNIQLDGKVVAKVYYEEKDIEDRKITIKTEFTKIIS